MSYELGPPIAQIWLASCHWHHDNSALHYCGPRN